MTDFKYFEIGDRIIHEMNADNGKPKEFFKRKHHFVVEINQDSFENPMNLPKGCIIR